MNWARKGMVQLFSGVMLIILLVGAQAVGVKQAVGQPADAESSLKQSKFYDKLASNALDQAKKSSTLGGTVSLDSPAVSQAAAESFTPQFAEQSTHTFIAANYAWLQGKTKTPQFTIDLSKPKQDFAAKIGAAVQTHLASVPVCTPPQLAQLQIPADPLTIRCRPASLNPQAEGSRVTAEVNKSDFFNPPVITADNLNSLTGATERGTPYYQHFSKAPSYYGLLSKLPLISLVVLLISIAVILFASATRRRGGRRIGFVFLVAGILLIIGSFVTQSLAKQLQTKVTARADKGLIAQPIGNLIHDITTKLARTDLLLGIVLCGIALLVMITLFATRRRENKPKQGRGSRSTFLDKDSPAQTENGFLDHDEAPQAPAVSSTPTRPSMDISGPPRLTKTPGRRPPISSSSELPNIKKASKPRKPRLIQ